MTEINRGSDSSALPLARSPGPVVAWLGYVALTLLMTYPVGFTLNEMFPPKGDYLQDMWTFWFLRSEVFGQGVSPYFTDLLYHPQGVNLALHSLTLANTGVGALLQELGPPWFAFNLLFLISFAFGGWGVYLLARDVTGHSGAAFLAGAIFTFTPFHFDFLHIKIVGIHFFPFFAWGFYRVLKTRRIIPAVVSGVLFTLIGLDSWYYLVHAVILGLLLGVYWVATNPRCVVVGRFWLALGVFSVTCVLTLLPLGLPVFQEVVEHGDDYQFVRQGKEILRSADLLGMRYRNALLLLSWPTFLGYTGLGLAIAGVVGGWRKGAGIWLFVLVAIFLLALGPQLRIGGRVIPGTGFLPYNLQEKIPFLNVGRHPKRILHLLVLAVSILAAFGFKNVLVWGRGFFCARRGAAVGVFVLGLFLVLGEMWQVPLPRRVSLEVSPFYERMRDDGGNYAVFDVAEDFLGLHMFHQTIHNKRIVQGYTSLTPDSARAFVTDKRISMLSKTRKARIEDFSREGVAHLQSAGVRYVILQKTARATQAKSQARGRRSMGGVVIPVVVAPFSLAFPRFMNDPRYVEEKRIVQEEYAARLVRYRAAIGLRLGEPVYEDHLIVVFEIVN